MLKKDKPLYNTIIVFTLIIIILYITKPSIIYNRKKQEFKYLGANRTIPIYTLNIPLAILLYMFFFYISKQKPNTYMQQINDIQIKLDNITQKLN